MNKKTWCIAACFSCFLMILSSGCGGPSPMALETKKKPLNLAEKPVGLFTLRISNQYKPDHQPNSGGIFIKSEGNKDIWFTLAKPVRQERNSFNEYLISVDLTPGKYTIEKIGGNSSSFMIMGSFKFPIGASFDLPADSMVYLGRINMVNRKRNENEPRSGPVIPLVDQAVCGFSDGTFDVTITDESGTDIPLFQQTYPELKNRIISTNIMQK